MGQGGRIRSAFARIVNGRGSSVDYGRGAAPRGASLASLGERDAGAAPIEAKLYRQQLGQRLAHARLCLLGAMQQQKSPTARAGDLSLQCTGCARLFVDLVAGGSRTA